MSHPLPPDHAARARYHLSGCLGTGTYGAVHRAVCQETGAVVALKVLKEPVGGADACARLREVQLLARAVHVNVIQLVEAVHDRGVLVLAFEHADENLLEFIQRRRGAAPGAGVVKSYASQLLHGTAFLHRGGVFHRDIKPENVLLIAGVVKIADFGSAKKMADAPHTPYVSTRWYRPPEVVLRSPAYTEAVDVWAVGAVLAELATLRPAFPGGSDVDMLYRIFAAVGTPTPTTWAEGCALIQRNGMLLPPPARTLHPLARQLQLTDAALAALLARALQLNPAARPPARALLQDPYFICSAP